VGAGVGGGVGVGVGAVVAATVEAGLGYVHVPLPPRALQDATSHTGLTPHACAQHRCISFDHELHHPVLLEHL